MLKNVTRSRLIQVWFTAVALAVVAGIALGVSVTLATAVTLVTLCLVPPVMILMLWPGVEPPTVREVLRGTERRN
jgi:hypothetical protein